MSVTFVGSLGSTKAYTSVLSATGSLEISGASRCDDIASLLRDGDEARDEPGVAARDLSCTDHDDDLALAGVPDVGDQWFGARSDRALRRRTRPGDAAGGAGDADCRRTGCRGFEERASRVACHAFLPKWLGGVGLRGTYVRATTTGSRRTRVACPRA